MKNLNLSCIPNSTGYGVVAHNILKTFHERNYKVSLFPKGPFDQNEITIECFNNSKFFDHDAPHLQIWHQDNLAVSYGRGKNFAWPIFELDKFSDIELHHLKYPDELIVCSKWASSVIKEQKISSPAHVVPLGVNTFTFCPEKNVNRCDNKTVFLNIGKWEVRKGHDILVEIFNKAFTKEDEVELWMLPNNPIIPKKEQIRWKGLYFNSPLGEKIKIFDWVNTQNDLANIIGQADCGIMPSRAEGFGLENLEMLAMGKQLITTDYSGHTEYCTNENSLLVPITEVEPAFDGKWFLEQGNWGSIKEKEIDMFVDMMKEVHKNKEFNENGVKTGNKFSWDRSVDLLEDILWK